jgi:hypothetical protein
VNRLRSLPVLLDFQSAISNPPTSSRWLFSEEERLKVAIRAAHERGWGTCGPGKVQDKLAEVEKIEAGINRIIRLRRAMEIRCK